jgi:hypothetical protein
MIEGAFHNSSPSDCPHSMPTHLGRLLLFQSGHLLLLFTFCCDLAAARANGMRPRGFQTAQVQVNSVDGQLCRWHCYDQIRAKLHAAFNSIFRNESSTVLFQDRHSRGCFRFAPHSRPDRSPRRAKGKALRGPGLFDTIRVEQEPHTVQQKEKNRDWRNVQEEKAAEE